MARVKSNVASRARRKKRLKLAKGYFGSKHRLYRTANEQVMRSQRYSYVGRKQLKREMRKLWITRINAAARLNNTTYSKLMHGLKMADVQVNRKMLSEMAIHDEKGFAELVKIANHALDNKKEVVKEEVVTKEVVEVETVKEEASEDLADYGNTWVDVVYNIIDKHLDTEFSVEDLLQYENIAQSIYPKNKTVEATMKRNLSTLVKDGKITEVEENLFRK